MLPILLPAYPQFFAVFVALRQALGLLPRVAAGPDLPEPVDAPGRDLLPEATGRDDAA